MAEKSKAEDFIFAVGVLIVSWVMLFADAPFRLDFKEQISIFLLDADRISWYLSNPAVVSSVIGDWLTQFYTNRVMAPTLSVILFAAIIIGLKDFFRKAEPNRPDCLPLMTVPVLLEGYFMTFPNYPVSATVGLAISVWAAVGLASLKDSKFSFLIYGLSVPVMFVIAGAHAFTLALLLAFLKRKDGIASLLAIATGVVILIICGRFYNLTLLHTFLWPVWPGYIIPHKALILLMPWLVLTVMILALFYEKVMDARWMRYLYPMIFILGMSVSGALKNDELERTVKIGTLAYHEQWKEVRLLAQQNMGKPYYAYYWNVCNAREGSLPQDLLKGRWSLPENALFLSTGRGDPYFSMMYFTDALLEMGDVSQATDCALLAQTVIPGHYSTRMLRRLAQIAVITADYDVARKYLNILMRTRNHRAWAQDLLESIETDDIPKQYLIWRSRTAPRDRFFAQGDIRSSLAILAQESPDNKVAADYLLCSNLLEKKVNTFVSLYDKYYLNSLDRTFVVPDLYQEALLVNVSSRESLIETARKYSLSQEVVDKYIHFMDARSADPNVLIDEARGTYWHYLMAVKLNNNQQ